MTSKTDPSHYQFGEVQVIEITEHLNFLLGNTVKYCCRAGRKDGETRLEDLEKALWYLERQIDNIRRTSNAQPPTPNNRDIAKADIEASEDVIHAPQANRLAALQRSSQQS